MNILTWGLLFGAAFILSLLAFVAKAAPVYTSLGSLIAWLVLGFGSTNLVWPSAGTSYTFSEAGTALFCFFHALLSGIVLLTAVMGDFGADEDDKEGTDAPHAGQDPWTINDVN